MTRGTTILPAMLVSLLAIGLSEPLRTAGAAEAQDKQLPPEVGKKAPNFELTTIDGHAIALDKLLKQGPVALVVLRGYPGYQCPICSRQFADLLGHADQFADARAQLVLVYPGPDHFLGRRAAEFVGDRKIPASFHMVIDPGYRFTNAYGLRWNAARETSYPSTFIMDRDGKIRWEHISREHGDRVRATKMLEELKRLRVER